MPIDALNILCAQLTRDRLAIAKFLLFEVVLIFYSTEYRTYGADLEFINRFLKKELEWCRLCKQLFAVR